jgi:5,10-methylenetetrahydrofolate reductase
MALSGDKAGAIKKLEASDDSRAKNLIEMIKRYDPNRKSTSLFDAADASADKIAAEKAADSKKAEAKPAENKPADKK